MNHSNYSSDFSQHNIMSLTGQGQVSVAPDVAIIRLGIQTNGFNLTETQAENAKISQTILQSLKQMGIEDIKTFQYQIEKNYTYDNGNRIDNGFTVRNIFEIRTDQIDQVGTIIDTAVANGANAVEFISFSVSNQEIYYQHALNLAVENAIQKSKSISLNLGLLMDPIPFHIVENSSAQPTPINTFREGAFATPIEPGNYIINAAVTIDFYY